ncbi:hypothetical protein QO207_30465 [Pseudomonas sp. CAN2814]|uniref:hypothetical protein n=1 Tax=Pseudomonas sp. CAN1 TaxID=3046726 RepID=UPI0026480995|nr:hypothetical protein [Pseudomonas sp. CAN1]MDN6860938.1 hypothetical protein [Pseudomonas sp. CAN1]
MQHDLSAPQYRVRFVRDGSAYEFQVADPAMSEARAWCHVARHLRIPISDLQGFQKAYHSIRNSVERHNVHDVSFKLTADPA